MDDRRHAGLIIFQPAAEVDPDLASVEPGAEPGAGREGGR
jgi:hypothetical protein